MSCELKTCWKLSAPVGHVWLRLEPCWGCAGLGCPWPSSAKWPECQLQVLLPEPCTGVLLDALNNHSLVFFPSCAFTALLSHGAAGSLVCHGQSLLERAGQGVDRKNRPAAEQASEV